MLPDLIRGRSAIKRAYTGEQLLSGDLDVSVDDDFRAFIDRVGAMPDDILFAFAVQFDSEQGTAGVTAFRVIGGSQDDLNREFQLVMNSPDIDVVWADATVGGKTVLSAEDPDNPGNAMHLYTVGDLIFLVTAPDDAVAGDILEDLP